MAKTFWCKECNKERDVNNKIILMVCHGCQEVMVEVENYE